MEEEELIIASESGIGPLTSLTLGGVITTVLNSKPKKLSDAISRLHSNIAPLNRGVSLEHSLCFLRNYILENDNHLDQLLLPVIQHWLKMRGSKRGNQSIILLNWLFHDHLLFQSLITNLAAILSRKDDPHIALAWCIMMRTLIDLEDADNNPHTDGIRQKHDAMLITLVPCIHRLISILSNGSIVQDGFELPTRLAVAAADFCLSLSVALTKKDFVSKNKKKPVSLNAKNQPDTLVQVATTAVDLKLLVWNNLDELIVLVKKITAWSRKSRYLHAKGSERILKWMQELKQHYGCLQNEADDLQVQKTGSLLLSSCWKHYGMLLHMEDYKFSQKYKELLDQYLSGIQFYAEDQTEEPSMNKESRAETINFFLNCLLLLLGRLNNQQFQNAAMEFGSRISEVLVSQLRSADEEVIDGSISLLKAVIFMTNHILSKCNRDDIAQMDSALPILLNLFDERDATAKAVIKLVADYCFICSNSDCLRDVLKQIDSKSVAQRMNAVDIIANLIQMSSETVNGLLQSTWQDVANYLLECLKDDDQILRDQAANLIPTIDPPLVLPALVGLSCSTNDKIYLSARRALIALLTNHKHEPQILCMLLDSLSNDQNPDLVTPTNANSGPMLDINMLLKLLSEWAETVEDWNALAGPLIDKMLSEPSNAVMVRFLSHISDYLSEASNVVFHRLISYMKNTKDDSMEDENRLFSRLCPLLVIRLLPLKVFDDISSSLVYGELPREFLVHENEHFSIEGIECISTLLINRALSKSEFEDVRKLAAELCGRIHPKVLIPLVCFLLERAAKSKDVFIIKVCLFSLCTSLMVRGTSAYCHPDLFRVRKLIHSVLSWTSTDGDEILKAQHGCIDCLALILCTELQAPHSSKGSCLEDINGNQSGEFCLYLHTKQDPHSSKGSCLEDINGNQSDDASFKGSLLSYVIKNLTDEKNSFESEKALSLPFRLCMANVFISACQKISGPGKKPFVKKILPPIIHSIKVMGNTEIRAACIQILFSVAYHLKSFVLPFSNDLLHLALKSLKEGSSKEKMAGGKLLASLMAGEEEVVESLETGLLEATTLLENLASMDPSSEVRQVCSQLLVCLTSP